MRGLPSNRLDKKVVSSWRVGGVIGSGIFTVILVGAAIALCVVTSASYLFIVAAVVLSLVSFALDVAIVPAIRYASWRYEVTEDEVDIFEGILVHKRTIIPLVRVQHVDTTQGPVLRAFGLASVSVATAAGNHEIPGLALEEADRLRDRVATLARMAQEDV